MIVCIAEKPSVGRDIAGILGATERKDGYMEGNGYQVTWTFGHLCTLFEPHDYNAQWRGWNMGSLPMIPDRFGIKVMDDKGVRKQFETIRTLMQAADMIVNCGDAGQEGELIQRWVMQKAGARCPVKRLWINSLTDEAIREGFQQLQDQSAYQHLYEAGLMRAIGDWLLGMNCTRAYTLKYQGSMQGQKAQPLSVGRVQTPTLALIVNRQNEINNFVPKTYWELQTVYRNVTFKALVKKSEEELLAEIEKAKEKGGKQKDASALTLDRLQAQNVGIAPIAALEEGEALVRSIAGSPFAVTAVERKKGTEGAPRLFDLTSLQVECNKKYAFSADKTLQLIQSLYEKHITTYPRVDTTFLPDDQYAKVPQILKGIDSYFPQVQRLRDMMREEQQRTGKPAKLPKTKKVFDNSKVTDHHAIIPTGQAPNNLSEDERKVYNLVALRFIAAFYPDCQIATTTVTGEVKPALSEQAPDAGAAGEPVVFRTSGRQILLKGWKEVFEMAQAGKAQTAKEGDDEDDDKDNGAETAVLPDFQKGESGAHQPALVERQTTPPKPYTEATLLRAMETAGRFVEDDELRDALKENGIGRPSTRAEIIKKLFQRKYIVQKGKSLYPTPTGERIIFLIQSPLLKSAELTGQWEKKLRQIERGELSAAGFLAELKQMTEDVIHEVKESKAGLLCPVCRQGYIIRGHAAYGCSRWREGCSYREPFA